MEISSVHDPMKETFIINLMGSRGLISRLVGAQRGSGSVGDKLRQELNSLVIRETVGSRDGTIALLVADLVDQGWFYRVEGNILHLHKPRTDNGIDKASYREPLLRERETKLREPATRNFIKRLERPRNHQGLALSILNLIADGQRLNESISNAGPSAIQPYLQIIESSSERDRFTGLKLQDIWRYFRLTWTLPYRPTPGRRIYILVRDAGQPYHPIVGIAALGNSIVHIPSRDDWIGWTVDSLSKRNLSRIELEAWYRMLSEALKEGIDQIYAKDIVGDRKIIDMPAMEVEEILRAALCDIPEGINSRTHADMDWLQLATTPLFRKKRVKALQRLVRAREVFGEFAHYPDTLTELMESPRGRRALAVALEVLKNRAIGSNIMDIIVCGAVSPYNHLLGGKLVSLLMLDASVRKSYENRYRGRVSIIASGMSGRAVSRDSSLVLLGTTSLYQVGSSQYNRLQISSDILGRSGPEKIGYHQIGMTEGYGSVYISDATVQAFQQLLAETMGRVPVTTNFGEGTSPRMRLIRMGLQFLGINPDLVLQHNFKRLVYMVELAENARTFLLGKENKPRYYFCTPENSSVLVEYWRNRWLTMRITNQSVMEKVQSFQASALLPSEGT